jgi:hypothetical protein
VLLRDQNGCTHMDDWPGKVRVIVPTFFFRRIELPVGCSNSYSRAG